MLDEGLWDDVWRSAYYHESEECEVSVSVYGHGGMWWTAWIKDHRVA